jgi:hypothetical protein
MERRSLGVMCRTGGGKMEGQVVGAPRMPPSFLQVMGVDAGFQRARYHPCAVEAVIPGNPSAFLMI